MRDLSPTEYVPIAMALLAAIGALWLAWKVERTGRAEDAKASAEREKASAERFARFARDVLRTENE